MKKEKPRMGSPRVETPFFYSRKRSTSGTLSLLGCDHVSMSLGGAWNLTEGTAMRPAIPEPSRIADPFALFGRERGSVGTRALSPLHCQTSHPNRHQQKLPQTDRRLLIYFPRGAALAHGGYGSPLWNERGKRFPRPQRAVRSKRPRQGPYRKYPLPERWDSDQ